MNDEQPQVFVELRSSGDECYAKARIKGDRVLRNSVGLLGSRDEAISEATSWALGWLRSLRDVKLVLGKR